MTEHTDRYTPPTAELDWEPEPWDRDKLEAGIYESRHQSTLLLRLQSIQEQLSYVYNELRPSYSYPEDKITQSPAFQVGLADGRLTAAIAALESELEAQG